ncbi:DUF4937 domain-containing protein [Terribacillus sp. DMT04]|uniref:DUF4937 domain-containing protein n=1 Tax=Terribacillus sp. DMT04 TaxID=2850441 RepID=UPI001C2BC77F|nr:DUF4937 domain-containing protein [Terribacillus sp. DMT04]QXE02306.1 YdbC family protein [Terribacillus sp. DMT04]
MFNSGQASWGQLNTISGFLGQIGGWDIKDNQMAHIVSMWEDANSYHYFMNNMHDEIYQNIPQSPSIQHIEEGTFAISLPFPEVKETADYFTDSSCIRIEQFLFNRLQKFHFTQVLLPGMLSAGNVGRTLFGESYKQENLFLTVTGWDSLEKDECYPENRFPELFQAADIHTYADLAEGFSFVVEKNWIVRKTSTC